ncbi:MAG: radical SAM protein [Clostridia bacterium]|nr:radical SAM protein [Clostridia bacterium]
MEKIFCNACPRHCNADREVGRGFCGVPDTFLIAHASKHFWEEPPLCGKGGSGTIFFSGCNLRCVYCQNYEVSHKAKGIFMTDEELEAAMLRLADEGAVNLNLVTPTQYAERLIPILKSFKAKCDLPIVYNCGGYESVEMLRTLGGLVDVYLPDFKYASGELAKKYSAAPDYPKVAEAALEEMLSQVGKPVFDETGLLKKGVIVRHLVLPGNRQNSIDVLKLLADRFGTKNYLLSLLWQYTPEFAKNSPYPELHRRVTTFEYRSVADLAVSLGFEGYFQEKESATSDFTPLFEGTEH